MLAVTLGLGEGALAQPRPYIGYVYPAGGQQGNRFPVKLGGQGLENSTGVTVTGQGVSAKVVECFRRLNPQEITLLNEQLKALKQNQTRSAAMMMDAQQPIMSSENQMEPASKRGVGQAPRLSAGAKAQAASAGEMPAPPDATQQLVARIRKRTTEYCNRPASAALAGLVFIEVSIAPDAEPGERELRIITPQGISNPMVFYVGQLPEVSRKPMLTSSYQVLGKEELALRKRPPEEVEDHITLPCVLNGQVASGEVNRYRFSAQKGQRLVISTRARQLVPFIADAVPGWFQPVLVLRDAEGKEVAYDDDYRFKPDPTILCQIPADGDYVLDIYDSIYRGREDFVYRITIGELPFVTSIFPMGSSVGAEVAIKAKGWNLESQDVTPPPAHAGPGIYRLAASSKGVRSNRLPFALDTLPEAQEQEPNDSLRHAQQVDLPIIVNGRMNHQGDWDLFKFSGHAGEAIAAEVYARRLDSPLDSLLKLTDATGKLLAWNDDHEDLASGINTHHADSYLLTKLPANGTYYLHLGDTARNAGEAYTYRLRISDAEPDFALRVVPSSISFRSKGSTSVSVYAIRKDGLTSPIRLSLKDAPPGFSAYPTSIIGTQQVVRLGIKTTLLATPEPVRLTIAGTAKVGSQEISHEAVPCEDRMQAFLWRHLVPASDLQALVYNPSAHSLAKRTPPPLPAGLTESSAATTNAPTARKPKFTKQQIAWRLRQLKLLYEDDLLTDDFYLAKVAECEVGR